MGRTNASGRASPDLAAPVFETFAWVIEFDSWADYGMYLDAVLADEDFQAGAGKLFGADAPATQTASSIENEIEI